MRSGQSSNTAKRTSWQRKMIIEVCSQKMAINLAEQTRVKTSIISITSKEAVDVVFPDNPNIQSVLHLKFNDLTDEYDEEGIPYGCPLPQPEDFAGLKGFVINLTCDLLIVHCWEGKSRSAAVAKAICMFRGQTCDLRSQEELSPNPLVYGLACRELGI
jgi:predicted protein tyrosine phosphatase